MNKRKSGYIIPLKTRVQKVALTIGGTALIFLMFTFANNFVVDGEFIIRSSTIEIQSAPTGTTVLIDSKLSGQILKDNSLKIKSIKPGKHTLIVTSNGYWPWVKEIHTKPGESIQITPLFISKEFIGKIVENEDIPANLDFTNAKVETDLYNIWADGATILMRESTSTKPVAVFTADYPVRAIALYPNRTDTLIIAAGDLIFSLDIDKADPRNFLPIYKSTHPTFAISEENGTIFVQDEDKIFKLSPWSTKF